MACLSPWEQAHARAEASPHAGTGTPHDAGLALRASARGRLRRIQAILPTAARQAR
ncbi:hypothetical protein L510_4939 [Bordetella bronchiseptica MBORD591]|nr:hypothetical protein L510_4939 [Bordetella bronchiseptica MBORD591]